VIRVSLLVALVAGLFAHEGEQPPAAAVAGALAWPSDGLIVTTDEAQSLNPNATVSGSQIIGPAGAMWCTGIDEHHMISGQLACTVPATAPVAGQWSTQ
jgi:hypothetical protein